MKPTSGRELESWLRASGSGPPAIDPESADAVAQRLAAFAYFLRLAPAPAAGSVGRLICPAGHGTVRVVSLGFAPIEVGRDAACSVRFEDREVSRNHCRVGADSLGPWIEDLGSTNGTWVDDQRLTGRIPLRDGNIIRVGQTVLVFARP